MHTWEEERSKVWGLILDLKRKIKQLENQLPPKEKLEQPAKRAEA